METRITVQELALAAKQERGDYTRELTKDERATIAETIAGVAQDEVDKAQAKKDAMADFNAELKELKERRLDLLKQKKTGFVEENGMLHYFFRDRTAYIYNDKGVLVKERPMRAEEYQIAIPDAEPGVIPISQAAN